MEFGSLEQSIYIDATPAVVYEAVSSPRHIVNWFVDEAEYKAESGGSGHLGVGEPDKRSFLPMTVVEAVPGVRFSFHWMAPPSPNLPPVGTTLTEENSLLVTFDLIPTGEGTLLKVTEAGMRELGWDAALLEHYYNNHKEGWLSLLGKLAAYTATIRAEA